MSRDRGAINFHFDEDLQPFEWLEMLQNFVAEGWTFRRPYNQRLSITPLNDDVIDWDGVELTDRHLKNLIQKKIETAESFGIAIFSERQNEEANNESAVLMQTRGTLSVWLGDDVRDIEGFLITDYSQYLPTFLSMIYKFRKEFALSITAYVE